MTSVLAVAEHVLNGQRLKVHLKSDGDTHKTDSRKEDFTKTSVDSVRTQVSQAQSVSLSNAKSIYTLLQKNTLPMLEGRTFFKRN